MPTASTLGDSTVPTKGTYTFSLSCAPACEESSLRCLGGGWRPVGDTQCGSLGDIWECGNSLFFITLSSILNECTGNDGVILVIRNSSSFEAGIISRQIHFDRSSPRGEE